MNRRLTITICISLLAHVALGTVLLSNWRAQPLPGGAMLEEIVMVEIVEEAAPADPVRGEPVEPQVSLPSNSLRSPPPHPSAKQRGGSASGGSPLPRRGRGDSTPEPRATSHEPQATSHKPRNPNPETHLSGTPGGNKTLAQIRRRIARSLYYPVEAKKRGLEGRPIISFRLQPDGSIADARLAQSSGTPLLDSAALTTIRRAAPLPYYPQAITIPIVYDLH